MRRNKLPDKVFDYALKTTVLVSLKSYFGKKKSFALEAMACSC